MLVAILCGGRGTRLQEHSPEVPKPLVEIGGRPILWHVIQIYAAQGYRRFRCRACKREFNERTGTPFNRLQYPTDVIWLVVLWRFC